MDYFSLLNTNAISKTSILYKKIKIELIKIKEYY